MNIVVASQIVGLVVVRQLGMASVKSASIRAGKAGAAPENREIA
jgi:hypothetical protein